MRENNGKLVLTAVVVLIYLGDNARYAINEPRKQSRDRTIYEVIGFNTTFCSTPKTKLP